MMKEEISTDNRARMCDMCQSTACTVYCRADLAYLCVACDAEIHAANPLARRHCRIPILPTNPAGSVVADAGGFLGLEEEGDGEEDVASWLLANPVKNIQNHNNNWNLFGDEFLDLIEYNSSEDNNNQLNIDHCNNTGDYNTDQLQQYEDSVVPVQRGEGENGRPQQQQQRHSFQFGLEYEKSDTDHGYPASMSHSVSVSSMDVGVVPESTNSDVSISHTRPPKGTIDLFSGGPIQMPTQLTPMDREARVLRYREKKKTRKFEKTIRYASRKAYAETRPRIKGRFAKRTELEVEVDQIYCNSLMSESGYCIVPSF